VFAVWAAVARARRQVGRQPQWEGGSAGVSCRAWRESHGCRSAVLLHSSGSRTGPQPRYRTSTTHARRLQQSACSPSTSPQRRVSRRRTARSTRALATPSSSCRAHLPPLPLGEAHGGHCDPPPAQDEPCSVAALVPPRHGPVPLRPRRPRAASHPPLVVSSVTRHCRFGTCVMAVARRHALRHGCGAAACAASWLWRGGMRRACRILGRHSRRPLWVCVTATLLFASAPHMHLAAADGGWLVSERDRISGTRSTGRPWSLCLGSWKEGHCLLAGSII